MIVSPDRDLSGGAARRASRRSSSRRPTAPAAPLRAAARRWSPSRTPCSSSPATSAGLGRGDRRAARGPRRARGAAATVMTTELDDPGAYGRVVRGADGEVERDRRDQGARATRPPRSSRSARSTPAPTPSTAAPLAEALDAPRQRQRPGRVLPADVLPLLREAGERVAAHRRRRPGGDPRGQRPRRPRRASSAEARRRILERHMRAGVTSSTPALDLDRRRRRDRRRHHDRARHARCAARRASARGCRRRPDDDADRLARSATDVTRRRTPT